MGVVVGVYVEAEGALIVTNSDPAVMLDRPIQPESQPVADPSNSNDDALVNDSRDDTDVSNMVEPLEKKDKRSKLHTYKQNLESFYVFHVKMIMCMMVVV